MSDISLINQAKSQFWSQLQDSAASFEIKDLQESAQRKQVKEITNLGTFFVTKAELEAKGLTIEKLDQVNLDKIARTDTQDNIYSESTHLFLDYLYATKNTSLHASGGVTHLQNFINLAEAQKKFETKIDMSLEQVDKLEPKQIAELRKKLRLKKWIPLGQMVAFIKTAKADKNQEVFDSYEDICSSFCLNKDLHHVLRIDNDVRPENLEHDIKSQSEHINRSIIEVISNAIDASTDRKALEEDSTKPRVNVEITKNGYKVSDLGIGMGPKILLENLLVSKYSEKSGDTTVGRFGLGFYTILSHIRSKNDFVKVTTHDGNKAYEMTFAYNKAWDALCVSIEESDKADQGTSIEMNCVGFDANDAKKLCNEFLAFNLKADIYVNNELINNTSDLKQLSDGVVTISYDPERSLEAQIRTEISGVKIEENKVDALNLPNRVVIDLPLGCSLPESRNELAIDAVARDAIKRVFKLALESEHPFKLASALFPVIQSMQSRNNSREQTDDLFVWARDQFKAKFTDVKFVPNIKGFENLESDQIKLLNKDLLGSNYPQVLGLERVIDFKSAGLKLYIADFKNNADEFLLEDRGSNALIMDRKIFEKYKDNPAALNAYMSAIGHGERKLPYLGVISFGSSAVENVNEEVETIPSSGNINFDESFAELLAVEQERIAQFSSYGTALLFSKELLMNCRIENEETYERLFSMGQHLQSLEIEMHRINSHRAGFPGERQYERRIGLGMGRRALDHERRDHIDHETIEDIGKNGFAKYLEKDALETNAARFNKEIKKSPVNFALHSAINCLYGIYNSSDELRPLLLMLYGARIPAFRNQHAFLGLKKHLQNDPSFKSVVSKLLEPALLESNISGSLLSKYLDAYIAERIGKDRLEISLRQFSNILLTIKPDLYKTENLEKLYNKYGTMNISPFEFLNDLSERYPLEFDDETMVKSFSDEASATMSCYQGRNRDTAILDLLDRFEEFSSSPVVEKLMQAKIDKAGDCRPGRPASPQSCLQSLFSGLLANTSILEPKIVSVGKFNLSPEQLALAEEFVDNNSSLYLEDQPDDVGFSVMLEDVALNSLAKVGKLEAENFKIILPFLMTQDLREGSAAHFDDEFLAQVRDLQYDAATNMKLFQLLSQILSSASLQVLPEHEVKAAKQRALDLFSGYISKLSDEDFKTTLSRFAGMFAVKDLFNPIVKTNYDQVHRDSRAYHVYLKEGGTILDEISAKDIALQLPAYQKQLNLSAMLQAKKLASSRFASFGGSLEQLSSMVGNLTEAKDLSFATREIAHAINHQIVNNDYLWIRELLQNSLDAIRNSPATANNNVVMRQSLVKDFETGTDNLAITIEDYIGMGLNEVINYLLIPNNSSKGDEDVGKFGVGFFTIFKNAKAVNIKTSKGNGQTNYFNIKPIRNKQGKIIDLDVAITVREEDYQGTSVQKIVDTAMPHMEASFAKSAFYSHGALVDADQFKLLYNEDQINHPTPLLATAALATKGILKAVDSPENALTQAGLYIKDLKDEHLKLIPKHIRKPLLRAGFSVDIPAKIDLIRSRNDIARKQELLPDLQMAVANASINAYLQLFVNGRMNFNDLPYDFWGGARRASLRMTPAIENDINAIINGKPVSSYEVYCNRSNLVKLMVHMPIVDYDEKKWSLSQLVDYFMKNPDASKEGLSKKLITFLDRAMGKKQEKKMYQAQAMASFGSTNTTRVSDFALSSLSSAELDQVKEKADAYLAFDDLLEKLYEALDAADVKRGYYYKISSCAAHAYQSTNFISWNMFSAGRYVQDLSDLIQKDHNQGKFERLLVDLISLGSHERQHNLEDAHESVTHNIEFLEKQRALIKHMVMNSDIDFNAMLQELKSNYKGDYLKPVEFLELAGFDLKD